MNLQKLIAIIACMLLTVGCKTVKEMNVAEEVIHYESFGQGAQVLTFENMEEAQRFLDSIAQEGANIFKYTASGVNLETLTEAEAFALGREAGNYFCKAKVTVFPNPTASSATVNVDLFDNVPKFGFRYKLIFDGRIIYEDFNPASESKITIPQHLIQADGVYVVAYEIYLGTFLFCANTVSFMVKKQQSF